MIVPLLDLKQQNLALEKELKSTFDRILFSGHYIMGEEVTRFEQNAAQFLGVKHALGISSGTDAILLALMALNIGPGDEVLCPVFTFFATAGCVARVGATPVWVDISLDDYNIDLKDAASKISSKTKAILPVHLFGQSVDMDGVLALAKKHNLHVIEDAAQSIGATYKGKATGTFGDFGCFSFFPTKNLGALGDAGLLVTNDDALAEYARMLRVHGSAKRYYHQFVGGNFRIDALQAALLNEKLPHLNDYTAKRRVNANFYLEQLSKIEGVGLPNKEPTKIVLPATHSNNAHIWHQFTLRVLGQGKRDALRQFLADKGIGSEVYYPLPLDKQECFKTNSRGAETIKFAHLCAAEVLSLPIYPELTQEQLAYVVATIREFLK